MKQPINYHRLLEVHGLTLPVALNARLPLNAQNSSWEEMLLLNQEIAS